MLISSGNPFAALALSILVYLMGCSGRCWPENTDHSVLALVGGLLPQNNLAAKASCQDTGLLSAAQDTSCVSLQHKKARNVCQSNDVARAMICCRVVIEQVQASTVKHASLGHLLLCILMSSQVSQAPQKKHS